MFLEVGPTYSLLSCSIKNCTGKKKEHKEKRNLDEQSLLPVLSPSLTHLWCFLKTVGNKKFTFNVHYLQKMNNIILEITKSTGSKTLNQNQYTNIHHQLTI